MPAHPIAYLESPVHTADGFRLTLFRSPPPAVALASRAAARPVLLLPGAGANRFTFGLRPERSLAAALNARGIDVWLAELRGARTTRPLPGRTPDVSLCLKLEHDLPALVHAIRAATGAERVDLVGHSLGGLLAMLAAGGTLGDHLGRIVTVSAPGTLRGFIGGAAGASDEAPGLLLRGLARGVEALAGNVDKLLIAPWAKTRGPIPHLVSFQKHFLPGALDAADRRLYLDHCVEDLPGGDLAQLARWVRRGALEDRHGHDLAPRLEAVRSPVLAIASPRDKVIPEALVRVGFDRLGSDDKTFVRVGREHGHRRDYAHADVLLAPSAVLDVLEPMARWLAQPLPEGAFRTSRRAARSA